MNFSKENIIYEHETHYIEFTQVKTKAKIILPLHPIVMHILAKNDGNFPRKISDQKYNNYIKLVCKNPGFDALLSGSKQLMIDVDGKPKPRKIIGIYPKYELITSHIGRRSFATNFYSKIPTPLLMNATGHTTEAMFLVYIGKTSNDKARLLAGYFNG